MHPSLNGNAGGLSERFWVPDDFMLQVQMLCNLDPNKSKEVIRSRAPGIGEKFQEFVWKLIPDQVAKLFYHSRFPLQTEVSFLSNGDDPSLKEKIPALPTDLSDDEELEYCRLLLNEPSHSKMKTLQTT